MTDDNKRDNTSAAEDTTLCSREQSSRAGGIFAPQSAPVMASSQLITSLNLSGPGGAIQVTEPYFYSTALQRGLMAFNADAWSTKHTDLEAGNALGTLLISSQAGTTHKRLVEMPEGLLYLELARGTASVRAAAKSPGVAAALVDRAKGVFPIPEPTEDQRLPFRFQGASFTMSRLLEVPRWEEIRGNYPPDVSARLTGLIERGPNQPGRLLLWQGPPGTGKTYALRSLAWEWREWCDVHYITDPEVFFGPQSEYMVGTLMTTERTDEESSRWKLLIAEDTGELIAKDAKSQSGQGLSRLLNMVDGLIGQGFKTMVLITSNEDLSGMHEAVTRPGRAGSIIEFVPFNQAEANEWLARQCKPEITDRKPRTLAELYAGATPQRTALGFAAGGGRKAA